MTDQGRSALAERLVPYDVYEFEIDPHGMMIQAPELAAAILGEHGLFIADASKHEPGVENSEVGYVLVCLCGWEYQGGESYFDHIVGAP